MNNGLGKNVQEEPERIELTPKTSPWFLVISSIIGLLVIIGVGLGTYYLAGQNKTKQANNLKLQNKSLTNQVNSLQANIKQAQPNQDKIAKTLKIINFDVSASFMQEKIDPAYKLDGCTGTTELPTLPPAKYLGKVGAYCMADSMKSGYRVGGNNQGDIAFAPINWTGNISYGTDGGGGWKLYPFNKHDGIRTDNPTSPRMTYATNSGGCQGCFLSSDFYFPTALKDANSFGPDAAGVYSSQRPTKALSGKFITKEIYQYTLPTNNGLQGYGVAYYKNSSSTPHSMVDSSFEIYLPVDQGDLASYLSNLYLQRLKANLKKGSL